MLANMIKIILTMKIFKVEEWHSVDLRGEYQCQTLGLFTSQRGHSAFNFFFLSLGIWLASVITHWANKLSIKHLILWKLITLFQSNNNLMEVLTEY